MAVMAGVAAMAIGTALVAMLASGGSGSLAKHTVAADAPRRTLVVGERSKVSEPGASLTVGLLRGAAPEGRQQATVTSDENCQPDDEGVSHCRNNIRLAGGEVIRVEHAHDMRVVPCLAPGEKVEVVGARST